MEAVVFRVEGTRETGVFYHPLSKFIKNNTLLYERHEDFNTPQQDGLKLKKDNQRWRCAYKDKEQLKSWITKKEMKYLISIGFKVYQIRTKEYQEGEFQVIFTRRGVIEKIDVTHEFI